MIEKTTTIQNSAGIHCRPSSMILTEVQNYPEHTFVVKSAAGESDLNSILSLLSLGIQHGDEVTLQVEGPDEENVCTKIAELFSYTFDFK